MSEFTKQHHKIVLGAIVGAIVILVLILCSASFALADDFLPVFNSNYDDVKFPDSITCQTNSLIVTPGGSTVLGSFCHTFSNTDLSANGLYTLHSDFGGSPDYTVSFTVNNGLIITNWLGILNAGNQGTLFLISPLNGSTATSSLVHFVFGFNTGVLMDTYNINVQNVNSGAVYNFSGAVSSLTGVIENYESFSIGDVLSWSVSLTSSTSPISYFSNSNIFSVYTTPQNPSETTYYYAFATTSTTSAATAVSPTNLLSFLNVPNLLKTKAPFAYIPQVYGVLVSAIQTATSSATTTGMFTYKWPTHWNTTTGVEDASSTKSVTMFSAAVIGTYLSADWLAVFRVLMVAVTYFSTGWFLFHDMKRRKII